ncbi:MAG: phosphoenolpyruvate synthase, partial [Gemmatimonadetes bacterium]|nr:phosphoenolpyruvate synthase [Gemmatimonadota bacterium]
MFEFSTSPSATTVRSERENDKGQTANVSAMIKWFGELGSDDTPLVGGKAASLGEMYGQLLGRGVRIPNGFATTTAVYEDFLDGSVPDGCWASVDCDETLQAVRVSVLQAPTLREALKILFSEGVEGDHLDLHARTAFARGLVLCTPLSPEIRDALGHGYEQLCEEYGMEVDCAVRSSATREDSAMASFAGQYESYLNVRTVDGIVEAWHKCAASAFTERAVGYQLKNGMDPLEGAVSVVVMKMVRSDIATSGVMFTLDPDSGNPNVIYVSSAYGLGEMVVQGSVSPDGFLLWKEGLRRGKSALVSRTLGAKDRKMVYSMQGGTTTESVDVGASRQRKWSLTREEVTELGRMALEIEDHYGMPMDIEWAKDGYSGDLFIVQARPETVHSQTQGQNVLETYKMDPALVARLKKDKLLVTGHAVGTRIGTGKVRMYDDYEDVIVRKRALRVMLKEGKRLEDIPAEERVFDPGDVLVTEMTTPDWEPLMKEASLIITEKGGRTSHAAIVAREFGIPAIVGAEDATKVLDPLTEVTGTCAEGDTGFVFAGNHPYEVDRVEIDTSEVLSTRIKLNVGFPDKALSDAMLPSDGVGLARVEFILTAQVGIHPLALYYYDLLKDYTASSELAPELEPYRDRIEAEGIEEMKYILGAVERRTPNYADKREFFVDQLKHGVGLICAAFYPRPVLVRLSDLKSNEYRDLLGGRLFEPAEENPMIAWRGASRYTDPAFLPAFDMECEALQFVRQQMGLDNLQLMVPFCRSPEEGEAVVQGLDQKGLSPAAGVPLFLMVELPSNVIEADRFIDRMKLTGRSIGSDDLVQTVYAVSRDDLEHYAHQVDARSPAVKAMIRSSVAAFRNRGLEIGICGQAPSDHPEEVPPFLVECGITSISVTPDTVVRVRLAVAEAERRVRGSSAGVESE